MRRHRRRHSGTETAVTNFSLTFAKAMLVFCVVLCVLINPQQGQDGVKPKAEFLISVDWQGDGKYDVDTWTRLPDGSRVNFQNKESGVVFLERDDLGHDCNATTHAGKPVNACEEIVVIRGVVPGEYTIALHLYSANQSVTPTSVKPIPVHVKIEKLNPTTTIVWQTTVELDRVRMEKGVVRFTMADNAMISSFETDDLPSMIYAGDDK